MSRQVKGNMTPCVVCGSTRFMATRCEVYRAEVSDDNFLEFLKLRDIVYEIRCYACDHTFERGPDEHLTQDFVD